MQDSEDYVVEHQEDKAGEMFGKPYESLIEEEELAVTEALEQDYRDMMNERRERDEELRDEEELVEQDQRKKEREDSL